MRCVETDLDHVGLLRLHYTFRVLETTCEEALMPIMTRQKCRLRLGPRSISLMLILAALAHEPEGRAAEIANQGARRQMPLQISGVYPHLTMRNQDNECGTGAVVVWQGDLWALTYSPHRPAGSTDKLYRITPELEQLIFSGSVGGTPANRMIHRESNQLLIGPYVIDDHKQIRVIPSSQMYGRLTGTARHLVDPANKVYYATMEEGLYSVDVHTLEVECHVRDGNSGAPEVGLVSQLLGYHGKGLYSGQGRIVYSNNGESGAQAQSDPTLSAGALAQWFGQGDWQLVRRNQFTEVSGPAGITGSENPATDPIWTLGWDARSLILGLLDQGEWSYYRLPKASHSYDGAHGWNTEWPRIREIGEGDLLATMHGTFWRFPVGFSRQNSAGIAPRSNYLKVVGDFCDWQGRIVLGCDDSAKSEFLNTRPFKAQQAAALQSNSNLWFIEPARLDQLGPAIGRGSVWLREDMQANQISDPYLFSGYDYRQLHLSHTSSHDVDFVLEVDRLGNNRWEPLRTITVRPGEAVSHVFTSAEAGAWIRLICAEAARGVTANFQYRNRDLRHAQNDSLFAGIATAPAPAAEVKLPAAEVKLPAASYAVMRSLAYNKLGIVAAVHPSGDDLGYYEMNQAMEIVPVENPQAAKQIVAAVAQPAGTICVDDASVIVVEDGRRFRIPKRQGYEGSEERTPAAPSGGTGIARVCREVATERDLLNVHGTFYELPARNAQGLAKLRPIATHDLEIHDFCSHNGLLLLSGIDGETHSENIFRSSDGRVGVWAGVVDDLWKLGKPRGVGGPWKDTQVTRDQPSDPYLMTAYDEKRVSLLSSVDAAIRLEVDVDGTDLWLPYRTFSLRADEAIEHEFPTGFSAYWVRAISDTDTTATVTFTYH